MNGLRSADFVLTAPATLVVDLVRWVAARSRRNAAIPERARRSSRKRSESI